MRKLNVGVRRVSSKLTRVRHPADKSQDPPPKQTRDKGRHIIAVPGLDLTYFALENFGAKVSYFTFSYISIVVSKSIFEHPYELIFVIW